ncbi:MAG: hypothetical protein ACHQ50_17395 [Fimbriimonadales bacterium]
MRCERCGIVEACCEGLTNAIDDTKTREAVESLKLTTEYIFR